LQGLHGFVSEQALKFEHVASVAQEVDGEGMSEAVYVGVVDAGALGYAHDEVEQGVSVEGAAAQAGK